MIALAVVAEGAGGGERPFTDLSRDLATTKRRGRCVANRTRRRVALSAGAARAVGRSIAVDGGSPGGGASTQVDGAHCVIDFGYAEAL